MKKSLLSIAAIASLAMLSTGAAVAQSSVTLFGTVDAAVRYVNNGAAGNQFSVTGDGNANNKIGFRGVEDLGGGLKVGFHLESGFAIDSGRQVDQSRFFNRRSTVSLMSDDMGELRIGRDFTPTYLAYTKFTAFGANGLANINTLVDNYGAVDNRVRADNQVAYFSPQISGFSAHVSASPSEGVEGRYTGGRLSYEAGAVGAVVGYGETKNLAGKFKQTSLGGSYDFGAVKALASVTQGKYLMNKSTVYSLGAVVPHGASGQFMGTYAKVNAGGDNKSDLLAVGYLYNMSKRTGLYTTAAYLRNSNGANRFLAAPVNPLVFGGKSTGVEVGLRHNF